MQGKADVIKRFLLWTALYFVGAVLASFFLRTAEGVALFWPSAGIGYVAAVRYGLRWTAVVAVASALFMTLVTHPPTTYLVYAVLGKTAATAIAAWYVLRGRMLHLRTDDGMRLLGGGVLLSLLSAASGVFGMVQAGMLKPDEMADDFVRWALGDMLGIAVVAPSLLLMTTTRVARHRLSPFFDSSSVRERVFWVLLLATSFVAIHSLGGRGIYVLGLISLPLVLLLWSALRFSPVWTAVSTAITVVYFSTATGMGLGGFTAPRTLLESMVLLLLLCLVAVIPVMMALAGLEQRTTSYALYQRATRDTLTGLLNRTAFEEEARRRLAASNAPATLLYIDLDNLKLINDSTSHVAGDDMIHAIAGAVGAVVGDEALLARTGGDEFAILLPRGEAGAIVEARRLLAEIEAMRVPWGDQALTTTASIGLVSATAQDRDYDMLFSHADAACFAAKELGGNRFHVSYPSSDEAQAHNAVMRSALRIREVLEREQFILYCQPIVPLPENGKSDIHFEVLLRWQEPDGKIHVPAEFISAAERFRMGPRIDRYVIDATLSWLERNPHAAKNVTSCGINLSGATLTDEHFADYLAARLRRSSFPARNLCLEITETSVVRDRNRAQRFIAQMRDLGCRFALDDFGTGFCSFGYLNDLDVDFIKIDGSFIRGLDGSKLSQAVVRSIADIAHVLGKTTIAEQVETEAERVRLEQMQVDYAQGYLFGRPQAIESFFAAQAAVA